MSGKEFRDPAKIVEERQEKQEHRSCTGCTHWSRLWGVVVCKKHEGRTGAQVSVCIDFERKGGAR